MLAVDPSSPFSGGALLGDRVRMQDHAGDSGVYIRSMASRGHLGGLAWATPQALRVLDAAGCDVVLIETVGVGQSELEIASLADTTLVLVAPGHGRRHPGGEGRASSRSPTSSSSTRPTATAPTRRCATCGTCSPSAAGTPRPGTGGRRSAGPSPPARPTTASTRSSRRSRSTGAWLESSGEGHRRREERAAREIEAIALAALRERMGDVHGSAALGSLAEPVVAGETDPYRAADELLAQL